VPLSFNSGLIHDVKASVYKDSAQWIQAKFDSFNSDKKEKAAAFVRAWKQDQHDSAEIISNSLKSINQQSDAYRKQFMTWGGKVSAKDKNDTNYIFLSFVKNYLPAGLKGLLIAIIFLAAWGSIAAALNSLAASTVVDFHQQLKKVLPIHEYKISQWYTLGWGVFCIVIAQFANNLGNSLIEAVNVLGSLFYGVILGIFLLAFYVKKVKGTAAFWAAVVMECFIILLFFNENIPALKFLPDISFLWMNAIGAIGVVFAGLFIQVLFVKKKVAEPAL
jgi:Na+/proline symporter